ncbi:MAG: hypothetical protein P4N59_25640 [Negativicutes bacterium]|nr:hypothetical protein [Negativicutes bacterium]
MKLKELRWKKTIMALAGVSVSWLDLYLLDQFKWYKAIHLIHPNDRE